MMHNELTTKTITLEGYEWQTAFEAMREHQRTWKGWIAEAERGERPNMSIEGAKMILDDITNILNKLA